MRALNESLGKATCPACGSKAADIKLSAKGLAYMVCNACNVQVFARSGVSDEHLRRWIGKTPANDAAADLPDPTPAARAKTSLQRPAPAPEPATQPAPQPTPARAGATPARNPFWIG